MKKFFLWSLAVILASMIQPNLCYHTYGSGPEKLILFHGFGQTSRAFASWLEQMPCGFTYYSFDLYYHGRSTRANQPLTLQEWERAFIEFIKFEGIDRFSIAAFSLGGRFAMATARLFPTRIRTLCLIAPDGLDQHPWYRIAVSRWGNPIFRYLMLHPRRFDQFLRLSSSLHLSSQALIRFAEKELSDHHRRIQVYRSWTYFHPLQMSPITFRVLTETNHWTLQLILGEYDRIILPKKIMHHLQDCPRLNVHLLPAKHHELIDASAHLIPSLFSAENL